MKKIKIKREVMLERKKHLAIIFDKLSEKSKVQLREGWRRFKIDKNNYISMRCQAKKTNTDPPEQCGHRAIQGYLVCKIHGGGIRKGKITKYNEEFQKEIGLYMAGENNALKDEIAAIKKLPPEQIKSAIEEVILGAALVRKYVKETSKEEIVRGPGRLMFLLDNLVRFKKTVYDMENAPKMSFTIEQVEYMFKKFQMMLTEVLDPSTFKKVSDKMSELGFIIDKEKVNIE